MNLFLAQKTNPLKSNLAKIFAVFLVCFFVGSIIAKQACAQAGGGLVPVAQPAEDPLSLYKNSNVPLPDGFGTNHSSAENVPILWGLTNWAESSATNLAYIKIPSDNNAVYQVFTSVKEGAILDQWPNRATFKMDPETNTWVRVPNLDNFPPGSTNLAFDPVALNKSAEAGGPLSYSGGGIIWTDKDGVPHNEGPVTNEADYNKLIAKVKADDATNGALAEKQLNDSKKVAAQNGSAMTSNAIQNNNPTNYSRPNLNCGASVMCIIAQLTYNLTIKPAAEIIYMAGSLLDRAIMFTVVQFKTTLSPSQALAGLSLMDVIKIVWGIFRDFINMALIFVLLYASIITILKADTARLKSTISHIIIVGLLINFSLFFTEAVIDLSNNLAVTIGSRITQTIGGTNDTNQNNLAVAFMNGLNLQSLMNQSNPDSNSSSNDVYYNMIAISIFGSIFLLVLAVLFFVMAVLFVVRFVELIVLLMMAPVGIGTIAIPRLKEVVGGDYWDTLLNQCFFAPIMMFFIWISVQLLNGITGGISYMNANGSKNPPNMQNVADMLTAKNPTAIGAYILGFVIVILVMIKGIGVAKSMSAKGAAGVQSGFLKYSGANWLQNKMQNAPRAIGKGAINGTGYVAGATARNTVGRGASWMTENKSLRNWASQNAVGRALFKGADRTAKAKFGGKTGFEQNRDASAKAAIELNKKLTDPTFKERKELEDQKAIVAQAEKEQNAVQKEIHARAALDAVERKQNLEGEKTKAKQQIFDASTPEEVKEGEKKLETIEKQITETNSALLSSFKAAGVEISDSSAESIKKATVRIDFSKNTAELEKTLKTLGEQSERENRSLRSIDKRLKDDASTRSIQYQRSLREKRIGNLFLPSKASKTAALDIRKENARNPEDKKEEAAIKRYIKSQMKADSHTVSKAPKKGTVAEAEKIEI